MVIQATMFKSAVFQRGENSYPFDYGKAFAFWTVFYQRRDINFYKFTSRFFKVGNNTGLPSPT